MQHQGPPSSIDRWNSKEVHGQTSSSNRRAWCGQAAAPPETSELPAVGFSHSIIHLTLMLTANPCFHLPASLPTPVLQRSTFPGQIHLTWSPITRAPSIPSYIQHLSVSGIIIASFNKESGKKEKETPVHMVPVIGPISYA